MAPEFETAGPEVETTDPGAEFAQFLLGNPAALETVESGQTVETEPASAAEILPLNPQKAVEGSASVEQAPSQEQLERMTGVQVGELVEELVGELVGGQLVGFQSWPDSPMRLPALVILVAAEVTAER